MILKKDALQMLDLLDDYRRNNQDKIDDYTVRLICAQIAEQAGYKDRNEWCDDLIKDETTKYSKYIKGATII